MSGEFAYCAATIRGVEPSCNEHTRVTEGEGEGEGEVRVKGLKG